MLSRIVVVPLTSKRRMELDHQINGLKWTTRTRIRMRAVKWGIIHSIIYLDLIVVVVVCSVMI